MYPLIAEIAEIDMVAPPFDLAVATEEAAEASLINGKPVLKWLIWFSTVFISMPLSLICLRSF